MRERPILFSAPMVRAILEGRKTQTRRVVKRIPWRPGVNPDFSQAREFSNAGEFRIAGSEEMTTGFRCPYGQPGERLWIRETWMPGYSHEADHEKGPQVSLLYRADNTEQRVAAPSYELAERWDRDFSEDGDHPPNWRPSIHMPRWACRLVLEVTGVRVERLHGISDQDCIAEGCAGGHDSIPNYRYNALPSEHFRWLWNSINGPDAWDANPWVWVVEFKRLEDQR